ncbi:MAG: hypothetical protein M1812_003440 [Candelaria pacifica]|nr:MAG: hypothetical protein M1812_003440 [Candelaria pacifica]
MGEAANHSNFSDRIHSWVRSKSHVSSSTLNGTDKRPADIPLTDAPAHQDASQLRNSWNPGDKSNHQSRKATNEHVVNNIPEDPPPAPPPEVVETLGEESTTIEPEQKQNLAMRFYKTTKDILLSTWLNVLLIFVPIGIAVQFAGLNPTIVFAMNAIAIIPLAGLLSHATESVASNMGDTIGALMNVTFGNAVELIIFMYVKLNKARQEREKSCCLASSYSIASHFALPIIALVKNELRIVQASLLGSILANLLLILGMCFLFGGLRFQEQTAFHASFTDFQVADRAVLQILLLVYVLYLLFQLKSHAYIYASTPQHVIDEESHPGVLADMLGSSTSSSSSSSSSSSDTDGSSNSNTTAKRLKRAFRGRRRRKSSASSKDTSLMTSALRTPSVGTTNDATETTESTAHSSPTHHNFPTQPPLGAIASGDEADTDGENADMPMRRRHTNIKARDFENAKGPSSPMSPERKTRKRSTKKKHKKTSSNNELDVNPSEKEVLSAAVGRKDFSETAERPAPRVGFIDPTPANEESSPSKRPFNIRALSRPTLPKVLSSNVFTSNGPPNTPFSIVSAQRTAPVVVNGIRRTNSLPDRLNEAQAVPSATSMQPLPHIMPATVINNQLETKANAKAKKYVSRNTAIILLLVSTGLVALCAEFLVGSINYLVGHTDVSEAFIGLIVLPIVGNAAEHVSAVTVASKNKMDLALGIAVGSSIQIALFVTPIIVLLGWCMNKDMSLYFNLFETVSLFVSAFIVNFLVLDGRSNYLEGALLIAAYIIIALAAFFFPDSSQQSSLGGSDDIVQAVKRML